jgi:hypothetical protein
MGVLSCKSYTNELATSPGRVDEGVTISTLHSISRAQTAYSVVNNGNYGSFEQLNAGGFLDGRFKTTKPVLYGYTLTMTTVPKADSVESSYTLNADPTGPADSKARHFFMDASGEIHFNASQPATANDEVLK